MSAGTLQPTYPQRRGGGGPTKHHQQNANHSTKRKSSDEQLTVPPTSTISPGTSSDAGSIEKQPTGLTLINVLIS